MKASVALLLLSVLAGCDAVDISQFQVGPFKEARGIFKADQSIQVYDYANRPQGLTNGVYTFKIDSDAYQKYNLATGKSLGKVSYHNFVLANDQETIRIPIPNEVLKSARVSRAEHDHQWTDTYAFTAAQLRQPYGLSIVVWNSPYGVTQTMEPKAQTNEVNADNRRLVLVSRRKIMSTVHVRLVEASSHSIVGEFTSQRLYWNQVTRKDLD